MSAGVQPTIPKDCLEMYAKYNGIAIPSVWTENPSGIQSRFLGPIRLGSITECCATLEGFEKNAAEKKIDLFDTVTNDPTHTKPQFWKTLHEYRKLVLQYVQENGLIELK